MGWMEGCGGVKMETTVLGKQYKQINKQNKYIKLKIKRELWVWGQHKYLSSSCVIHLAL